MSRFLFASCLSATLFNLIVMPALAQPVSAYTDFFPHGRLFPCAAYSIGATDRGTDHLAENTQWRRQEFQRAKDAGINVVGPQYDLNDVVLEDAEQHAMGAIYFVGSEINFATWAGTASEIAGVKETVRQQVRQVAENNRILLWYLQTEELRPWRPKEMQYLAAVSAAVSEADPKKRPLMMYEPGHRTSSELMETTKYLGVVSKGVYVNYGGMSERRAWVAAAMAQQRAAAMARGSKSVVFIPEMFADARDSALVRRFTAHDLLRGLVEGAQMVTFFSFRHRAGFGHYDEYYEGYAAISKHVCGDGRFGQALLFGEPNAQIRATQVAGPKTTPFIFRAEKFEPSTLGQVTRKLNGATYVLLVNSSPEPIKVQIDGLPDRHDRISVISSQASAVDLASRSASFDAWGTLMLIAGPD